MENVLNHLIVECSKMKGTRPLGFVPFIILLNIKEKLLISVRKLSNTK
jgi:hypothetical protein